MVFTPKSLVLEYDNATGTKISPQEVQFLVHAEALREFMTPTVTKQQPVKFAVPKAKRIKHQSDPILSLMDTTKTTKLQNELQRFDCCTFVDNSKV